MKNVQELEDYLSSFIAKPGSGKPRGNFGHERAKSLLVQLGNPQNDYPALHIAGTSGKGSTAYATSAILQSQGYDVGLMTSPHLTNVLERCQINNKILEIESVSSVLEQLKQAVEKCTDSFFGEPSYYEVVIALSFLLFSKEKIDVAVVEVGLGGLLDGTNVMTRKDKICIITKQGYDHEAFVGDTLEQITYNDTGIIGQGNTVISLYHQQPICREVLEYFCKEKKADLTYVFPDESGEDLPVYPEKNKFIYERNSYTTSLLGAYQAENFSLAIKASEFFLERNGKVIDQASLVKSIQELRVPGRFEIQERKGQLVVFDGAHNPQKMRAFIKSLKSYFSDCSFHFLLSFKGDKKAGEMLDTIRPEAKTITTCNYDLHQDIVFKTYDESFYQKYFKKKKLTRQHRQEPFEALESVSTLLSEKSQETEEENNEEEKSKKVREREVIVVTGSLYLLAYLYTQKNLFN